MDKEVRRLIRAKKIRVKLGMPYLAKDKFGNVTWWIGQFPELKK